MLESLKNLLQREMRWDPMPETNHTKRQRKSRKFYSKYSPCSKKCDYFSPARLSTSGKRESSSTHLKTSSQNNSTNQIRDPRLDAEAPNLSSQIGTPSSKSPWLSYNVEKGDPLTHLHLYTYNISLPSENPFSLNCHKWESDPKPLST